MEKKLPSKNKLRGGYYTPIKIADFLTAWALDGITKDSSILEPSMGDGVFVSAVINNLEGKKFPNKSVEKMIYGIELFKEETRKAKKSIDERGYKSANFNLRTGDFFEFVKNSSEINRFDVVLGNPPFIRYQNFPRKQRDIAEKILSKNEIHLNKLTNAWAFFLLVSVLLLKENGKIAMVLPAELLQVGYASKIRIFLSKIFHSVTIVTFKKLTFKDIQQEVILLMGDKSKQGPGGINIIELSSLDDLSLGNIKSATRFKPIDHDTDKWTQYFLSDAEILLLRKLKESNKLCRLGELIEVDVGIVTGNNDYFAVSEEIVKKYNLENYVVPLVGRTAYINGNLVFTVDNWEKLRREGKTCYLFSYDKKVEVDTPKMVRKYLDHGIEMKVQLGYKCRIRKMWHSVPSTWIPDAFLSRQIHLYPKLILNKAQVVPTDTIHRVRFKKNIDPRKMQVLFHNSLTFAYSEILGRSYGGGVLELEPSEAENLLVPSPEFININLSQAKELFPNKDLDGVLDKIDKVILHEGLGLTINDIKLLKSAWTKLSERRRARKLK